MLINNPRAQRSEYALRDILSIAQADESRAWLSTWPRLNPAPTPLYSLAHAAAHFGIASLHVKDESQRSALGSFKALGAPVALLRLVTRLWHTHRLDPRALFEGQHASLLAHLTVISATDGNHGKALAAAARSLGCQCVIVLHAQVSAERERAIASEGARIMRIDGNYDASVAEAARLAHVNGWHVVSDTSYDGYTEIPRDVMQGYGTIPAEIIEQTTSARDTPAFTHVLLQGGVGGLAAGVASYFCEWHGARRPHFIVVEPHQADCLYQSALAGHAAHATGSVDSIMAGLACGAASPLAWRVLEPCIDTFMTISDDEAIAAMRVLSDPSTNDVPIVAGESGAAGFAGLAALMRERSLAALAGLNSQSRVLVINTEGATAPALYEELTGQHPEDVLARQRTISHLA
ncbi:diaminopropionate ammonia-lyase [Caballeronia sp. LZ032]|uniref:diaminopropionate ammonia-lyase n=1 Tax=Caballeronia sp. LZ032 TaxID=3038565 RepID=UPI002858C61E|nr:diaminopropionate ammonia-lyase [Caballeronia sp. LZ032]MDR5884138.1 diaminopropionate ammonia-lyase [Caballeronia sp. LZ032]